MIEWYVRYAFKILTHAQRTSIRSLAPTDAAEYDYYVWTHQLLKRMNVSQPCYSWFKGTGEAHAPVTAVYAGSRAHFYEALKEPRLEDFDVKYDGGGDMGAGNRFAYLGNGFTRAEAVERQLATSGASNSNGSSRGGVGGGRADVVWYLEVLRREHADGADVHDINPVKPRRQPADEDIVIPKGTTNTRVSRI
jgi:hypothetical protein